jgi:hypothetical protein
MVCAVCDKRFTPTPVPELERLEAQVRIRLGGRVLNLRLLMRDNGLVLKGRARTYYAKQLAQHAAVQIAEYRIHANEIEVVRGEEDGWFRRDP